MKNFFKTSSSSQTAQFYDALMEGEEKRWTLGKDTRFNAVRIARRASTHKYFGNVVRPHLKENDVVLDFGCGPGSFLAVASLFCQKIIGVDISQKFIDSCDSTLRELNLGNAEAQHIAPGNLPFSDHTFDAVIMVDVLHHLENIDPNLREVCRVLKPGGKMLIFEPNLLNPMMALMHALDRNEWGLLKLGTPWRYRRVLKSFLKIDTLAFNGIVIGPESGIFPLISDFLDLGIIRPWLGWLMPKIFIAGIKPDKKD
ncbi:MAG: SAM-dependent methyltransferase [Magnetococcales bacterium]|nr:SAM-dependent methyltransferase [Magnetococcales bacterium]HIJ85365.1 class I SAM-dependent methyltransferase [Magnetococcales bacterium]